MVRSDVDDANLEWWKDTNLKWIGVDLEVQIRRNGTGQDLGGDKNGSNKI